MFRTSLADTRSPAETLPGIIPRPAEFSPRQSRFSLAGKQALFLCEGTGPEDRFAAVEFNLWLAELGLDTLEVRSNPPAAGAPLGAILVGPAVAGGAVARELQRLGVESRSTPDEGYLIAVGEPAAVLFSPGAAGRFYALMTLAQMLYRGKSRGFLPGGVLRDRPALGLRGISDDISRGQVSTLEDLKNLIRLSARYKLNLYMPYLEDMFTFAGHPDIGAGRGALTKADAGELVRFARQFHVRVVPVFQCLGHYENLLLREPYLPLAEFPGAQTLSPASEDTYTFLRQALGEIVPAFEDSLFNMACDESWDVGLGKSRPLVARYGLSGVHARHYRRVHEILTGLGRKVLMYGDIVLNNPAILKDIPKDIIFVDWHYEARKDYPSAAKFRQAGFEVLVSPAVVNYNRLYPDWRSALVNIENFTRVGFENQALGAVTSSWCDNGAFNLRQFNLWGYVFAAACAWNPENVEPGNIEKTFWENLFAVDSGAPFVELNARLSNLGQGSTLYDWWRHPLLGISTSGGVGKNGDPRQKSSRLAADLARVMELIAQCRKAVRANRPYLDVLDFAAACGLCLAHKLQWQADYAAAASGRPTGPQLQQLLGGAESLLAELTGLERRFSTLWLRYNRPEGLENNLDLYHRQLEAWRGIIADLRRGALPSPADLPSEWITPAGSGAAARTKAPRCAYFRAEFSVHRDSLSGALVQLMGTSHVEAWLNDEYLGKVIARRSLSLIVEKERAVIFDIAPKLKEGRNRLTIKATNYEGRAPALNVYGELYAKKGSVERIMSASAWRGLETGLEPEGWRGDTFKDSAWRSCERYSLGARVSRPDLLKGVNSRIQR